MSLRDEWEFKFAATKLAAAASAKKKHHEERQKFWTDAKAKVMVEVKESGIEVSESEAAGLYTNQKIAPQVMVRNDLQRKLTECHQKIIEHSAKVSEYAGWIQVFESDLSDTLSLHADDYLYFFGA